MAEIILENNIGLIGDFIGTIPAMVELAKENGGELKIVNLSMEVRNLFNMIPKKHGLKITMFEKPTHSFDLMRAFNLASRFNLHMTQAHFHQIGLPVPNKIPRPELEFEQWNTYPFDVILAPFSRSLPEEQKWPQEKWQELVNRLPHFNFALLGNRKYDDPKFVTGPNVTVSFSKPMQFVANVMKNAGTTLSVVTGISHFAHAIQADNILFINQGVWGKNPDAHCLTDFIPNISVDEVEDKILCQLVKKSGI